MNATRRTALAAGTALLAGCADGDGGLPRARAQGGPPPRRPAPGGPGPVVLAPHPPCRERPGDVVGVLLEGPCEAGVVVFGQAFRPGDVPRGAGLAARAARGAAIAAQLDVQARHEDGSARHGVVSLAVPRLGSGERLGVMLALGEPGAALDRDAALANRSAVLEITPAAGGTPTGGAPWRADLLALWREARGRPWQSGPLAVQGRVAVPVPAAAVGGVASMRLVADLAVRADGTLWADVFLRNDVAMRQNGGEAAYAMRLSLDGREVLAASPARHAQYQGWGRLRGARAGSAAEPTVALVRHDVAYLAAARAIMPYDLTTGVSEGELARMGQLAADAQWDAPFNPRGIRTEMGAPGGRADLGVTTLWQAAWLLSGDRRAWRVALDQAEMSANIPWHFWDPGGGRDGTGGWLDVERWPRLWTDVRGGRPPLTLTQPVAGRETTGWATTPSHAPALSYVPYLLTGRRALLDNHMAQAGWNVVGVWPSSRSAASGRMWPTDGAPPTAGAAADMLVVYTQARAAAWALRTLGEAGWIAPDDDPNRAHFRRVETLNWAWLREQTPAWTRLQGEVHGYVLGPGFGHGSSMTIFSREYLHSVAALAALRGGADARAMVEWMSNFIVGRFMAEDRGFMRPDAVAYQIAISAEPPPRPTSPPARPFTTWREIGEAMRARNMGNTDGRWRATNGEYARLAMLSVALTHHVTGDARSLEAYDWLAGSGAPYTSTGVLARTPQHNVAPGVRPRVAGRGAGCAA